MTQTAIEQDQRPLVLAESLISYVMPDSLKRYALTGGPCSGKSALILELECRGEWVTREAAEDYIERRQAHGIEYPWEEPDFQQQILDLSIQREQRVPRNIKRVFHGRSVGDGLAYEPEGTYTFKDILRAARQRENREGNLNRYERIFMIGLLDRFVPTRIRREDRKKAEELQERLYEVYRGLGYEPVYIPDGSVDARVRMILENL